MYGKPYETSLFPRQRDNWKKLNSGSPLAFRPAKLTHARRVGRIAHVKQQKAATLFGQEGRMEFRARAKLSQNVRYDRTTARDCNRSRRGRCISGGQQTSTADLQADAPRAV